MSLIKSNFSPTTNVKALENIPKICVQTISLASAQNEWSWISCISHSYDDDDASFSLARGGRWCVWGSGSVRHTQSLSHNQEEVWVSSLIKDERCRREYSKQFATIVWRPHLDWRPVYISHATRVSRVNVILECVQLSSEAFKRSFFTHVPRLSHLFTERERERSCIHSLL